MKLNDFLFHGVVEGVGFLEIVLEEGDGVGFGLDNCHEFVDNKVGHVDDLFFEEGKFGCEGGQDGFEIEQRLMERLGGVMGKGDVFGGDGGAVETD